jgi:hypothetical protein
MSFLIVAIAVSLICGINMGYTAAALKLRREGKKELKIEDIDVWK